MASSSFILCAQCAICFRSLPLTPWCTTAMLSYLYFSLWLPRVCVSVCASIFFFFFCRLPTGLTSGSRSQSCVSLWPSLLILWHPFPSSPFLVRSIRSFPHASCQTKMEESSSARSFFFSSSTCRLLRLVALTTVLSFKRVACQFVCRRRNTSSFAIRLVSSFSREKKKKKKEYSSTRRRQPKV
jgi:hypothetical protein